MIKIIKELNVEVTKPNIFQAIVAKQYDMNTRFLKVALIDCGKRIDIPNEPSISVIINAERIDGQSKGFNGEVNDDGTVMVPLHSWMLELEGTVSCDISVVNTATDNNQKLTTTSFALIVEKSVYGGDDVTSDPQYDVLLELIERVEKAEKGTADQTYNPESVFAQSGIAVAQAVDSAKSYADDIFANAIKETKSGEIIVADDVSSVEHSLGVKVENKNVPNQALSTVNVIASGLNLFKPFNAEATKNGIIAKTTEDGFVKISGEYSVANTILYLYSPQEYERVIYPAGQYSRYLANYNGFTYSSDIDINFQCIYLNGGSFNMQSGVVTTATSPFYIKDILVQIRKETAMGAKMPLIFSFAGLNITEFEPYKNITTATANADGTVTGLTSVSQNMVVATDTEGVIIDATYNVDTKTYIDRKFAELSQTLLNL